MATVEALYQRLLSNPKDVTLSQSEAAEVWKAFGAEDGATPSFNVFKTRAFLQAAMMGWIEASVSTRWIEAILMASLKPSATITSLVAKLVTEAFKIYYEREIKGDKPLYIMVRNTIVQQNRPYFTMIAQGMELP